MSLRITSLGPFSADLVLQRYVTVCTSSTEIASYNDLASLSATNTHTSALTPRSTPGQHAADGDDALKSLLQQLRVEHADAVRASFEGRAAGRQARDRSVGAWGLYWRGKHELLGEAEARFVAAEREGLGLGAEVEGAEAPGEEMPPAYAGGGSGGLVLRVSERLG